MRLSKGDAWIEASVTRGNQGELEAPVTHSTEVPTKLTVISQYRHIHSHLFWHPCEAVPCFPSLNVVLFSFYFQSIHCRFLLTHLLLIY